MIHVAHAYHMHKITCVYTLTRTDTRVASLTRVAVFIDNVQVLITTNMHAYSLTTYLNMNYVPSLYYLKVNYS